MPRPKQRKAAPTGRETCADIVHRECSLNGIDPSRHEMLTEMLIRTYRRWRQLGDMHHREPEEVSELNALTRELRLLAKEMGLTPAELRKAAKEKPPHGPAQPAAARTIRIA